MISIFFIIGIYLNTKLLNILKDYYKQDLISDRKILEKNITTYFHSNSFDINKFISIYNNNKEYINNITITNEHRYVLYSTKKSLLGKKYIKDTIPMDDIKFMEVDDKSLINTIIKFENLNVYYYLVVEYNKEYINCITNNIKYTTYSLFILLFLVFIIKYIFINKYYFLSPIKQLIKLTKYHDMQIEKFPLKELEFLKNRFMTAIKKADKSRMYIKTILDSQKDIVIITDGRDLYDTNRAFFDFFTKYETLSSFKKEHKCVCDFFEESKDSGYISGKWVDNSNWIDFIFSNLDKEHKVIMIKDNKEHRFLLKVNHFKFKKLERKIISFIDITEIENYKKRLEVVSTTDGLTGIYNRIKIEEILSSEFNRAKRYQQSFSILILDIDKFKLVNDTYGHQIGDIVLKEFTSVIKKAIRGSDLFARWGGEEFIILSPNTDIKGAKVVAEHIREELAQFTFTKVGKKTSSFGISEYKDSDTSYNQVIKRADDALYIAKSKGRDRVDYIY
jgi:diguanylate cyclase (GGDEF)-like protein